MLIFRAGTGQVSQLCAASGFLTSKDEHVVCTAAPCLWITRRVTAQKHNENDLEEGEVTHLRTNTPCHHY